MSQQIPGCGDRAWNWKLKLAVSAHNKMKTSGHGNRPGKMGSNPATVSSRVPPCDGKSTRGNVTKV
eukprot:683916-Pleurochrysis_carterae.AAC.1